MTFSEEARKEFLDFALSPAAAWNGNFRDLNGAVIRMATLSLGERISVEEVREEIARLREAWEAPESSVLTAFVAAKR